MPDGSEKDPDDGETYTVANRMLHKNLVDPLLPCADVPTFELSPSRALSSL
jgi:hypothetical protein